MAVSTSSSSRSLVVFFLVVELVVVVCLEVLDLVLEVPGPTTRTITRSVLVFLLYLVNQHL